MSDTFGVHLQNARAKLVDAMARRRTRNQSADTTWSWLWTPGAKLAEIEIAQRSATAQLDEQARRAIHHDAQLREQAQANTLVDWFIYSRLRKLPPSIPALVLSDRAHAKSFQARLREGKRNGLIDKPSGVTKRALGVLEAGALRYLLQLDSVVASNAQRRRHVAHDDVSILRSDVARFQAEANRWSRVASLLATTCEVIERVPPASRPDSPYTYAGVGFQLSPARTFAPGELFPEEVRTFAANAGYADFPARRLVPIDVQAINVVRRIARDARGLQQSATEQVARSSARLREAASTRLARLKVAERLAVLLAVLQAGDFSWNVGDLADLIVASLRDWRESPCDGLARKYFYDQTSPAKRTELRRARLISWIEKVLQRRPGPAVDEQIVDGSGHFQGACQTRDRNVSGARISL